MPKVKVQVTSDKRYRSYKDLSYDELNDLVKSLETDSKRAKKNATLREQVLGAVSEAKTEIAKRIIK
tara:strand:- start:1675 stop:1875 length:201 start_codon:yes stop_codon:yes gene_type:complete